MFPVSHVLGTRSLRVNRVSDEAKRETQKLNSAERNARLAIRVRTSGCPARGDTNGGRSSFKEENLGKQNLFERERERKRDTPLDKWENLVASDVQGRTETN